MKLLLEIEDNKADFVLELLANLSFYVKTTKIDNDNNVLEAQVQESLRRLQLLESGENNSKNWSDFKKELLAKQ